METRKHCRACEQVPDCICTTCKHDDMYAAPACCSRCPLEERTGGEDVCGGIAECEAYEPEEET